MPEKYSNDVAAHAATRDLVLGKRGDIRGAHGVHADDNSQ
jgi:hypothetical protein